MRASVRDSYLASRCYLVIGSETIVHVRNIETVESGEEKPFHSELLD